MKLHSAVVDYFSAPGSPRTSSTLLSGPDGGAAPTDRSAVVLIERGGLALALPFTRQPAGGSSILVYVEDLDTAFFTLILNNKYILRPYSL